MQNIFRCQSRKMNPKYNPIYLTLDEYQYAWFEREDEESAIASPMSPLESDKEEVKEKTGFKISILKNY